LQVLEIPENRQGFVWKSLEQKGSDLEKLGEKACRRRQAPAAIRARRTRLRAENDFPK
jgi:hypothetical protein